MENNKIYVVGRYFSNDIFLCLNKSDAEEMYMDLALESFYENFLTDIQLFNKVKRAIEEKYIEDCFLIPVSLFGENKK